MLQIAGSPQSDHKAGELTGKRILVVEDDPVIAVDYLFELKSCGASEAIEPSNRQALDYLADHAVDGAIVDVCLQDGCCTPVLEYLMARHIPFVVVSGDMFAMRHMATDAPVLSKPVSSSEVCLALSAVVD